MKNNKDSYDWKDRTLIKLNRKYSKDELIIALNSRIKELETKILKQNNDIEAYKKLLKL